MQHELTIEAVGAQGDGVAVTTTGKVFVPFTLAGERVSAEIHGTQAKLAQVIEPSPLRIEPICKHFGFCGGCALQHMEAQAYHAWKRQRVLDALRTRGLEADVAPVISMPARSRRRAVLTAGRDNGDLRLGLHQASSRALIDLEECPVLVPAIADALPQLRHLIQPLLPRGATARLTITACDNGLDILIELNGGATTRHFARLAAARGMKNVARLIVNDEHIFWQAEPLIHLAGIPVSPPPGAFLQAVEAAQEIMIQFVTEGVGKAKAVADLYCGLGTFSLPLARAARVTAVEGDGRLLSALERAARSAAGLKPVTMKRRDLEREPLSATELNHFEAVVFDPPRAGAMTQAREIAKSRLKRAVAVSCYPPSFARDARILVDSGFRISKILPIDQFLYSPHVELVALFER